MLAVPHREAVRRALAEQYALHKLTPAQRLERERRLLAKLRESLGHSDEQQRDYQRWCGLPLGFTATAVYGAGASPLTLSSAQYLASWHLSSRGQTLGATLIKSVPTDPSVSFTTDVNQSVPLRMDVLTGGTRGVATYGLTIDGGVSYFQSGVTATTVPVPLFGQSLTMNLGTFTLGTQYTAVSASMTNQTSAARTLVSGVADSTRPLLLPLQLNGYPALQGVGGTSSGMLDTTSTWAAEVCSSPSPGVSKDFTWVFCMAADSAAPSAARVFLSFAHNTLNDPIYGFTSRNGSNNYRAWHVNDAAASQLREAGALDTSFHVYTFQQSSGNVSVWVDGVNIVNALTFLPSTTTTCNNVALWVANRGSSGQTNVGRHLFTELCTYTTALSTAQWQEVGAYMKGKYGTP